VAGGGETREGAVEALSRAKAAHHLAHPLLVTCDFSEKLIAAVREVFGPGVLNMDGFHVMQLLNNGIRRDLLDFRDRAFQAEIRELFALRRWISKVQGEVKGAGRPAPETLASPPPVDPSHGASATCLGIARQALSLFSVGTPAGFFASLDEFLSRLAREGGEAALAFCTSLRATLPKRQPTRKGQARSQAEVLKKLKTLFLAYRSALQKEGLAFYRDHWVLFFQPERLTAKRAARLAAFLAKYPALQEYRDLTLLVGQIYRLAPADIDGHQIEVLEPRSHYSAKLQAAIQTIKEHRDDILRFVEVFKARPGLSKRCRANMEPLNQRVKAPFRRGKNCTKQPHLQAKLQLQLGCEVRFLSKEEGAISP
jgi:hypothetical protein